MRCASARKLINDGLDGALPPNRTEDLKRHLAGCPGCRGFARELESIIGEAKNLPVPEPSGAVWPRIVSGIRTARADEPAPRVATFRWRYALASASALVMIGAGLIIGLRVRRPAGVIDRGSAAFTLAKLREAQSYYEKAIAALSEAVRSQESGLAPGLADVFERNLAGLDRTIQVCRQMVERRPDDPVIRAYLLTVYREKVDLFEEIIGVEQMPRDKIKTTTL